MTRRTDPRLPQAAWVLLLALLLLPGCRSSHLSARRLPPELIATPSAGQHQMRLQGFSSTGAASDQIGAGDLLEVTVVSGRAEEETSPVLTRVAESGEVDIAFIGAVGVADLEPSAAAEKIAQEAVGRGVYVRPQVNVVIKEQATNRVTVLGAVAEPGVQEVPRSACDVLSAIAHAGGFTEEAGTVVEILRHESPSFIAQEQEQQQEEDAVRQASFSAPPLDPPNPRAPITRTERIDLAMLDDSAPKQYGLDDRDVVVVRPREKRVVHVSGLVQKPNQFEMPDDHDLRLLDAVAMAGGVTTPVADKVIVIRSSETRPEPVVVQVSLAKAKRDGRENMMLQSGDLVSVEPTIATTFVETFRDLFRVTMGVGGNLTLF